MYFGAFPPLAMAEISRWICSEVIFPNFIGMSRWKVFRRRRMYPATVEGDRTPSRDLM